MTLAGEVILIVIFCLMTATGIYFMARHQRLTTKEVDQSLPPAVREKSHEVKNRVTSIRAGLNRIKNDPDPLGALVDAIERGRRDD